MLPISTVGNVMVRLRSQKIGTVMYYQKQVLTVTGTEKNLQNFCIGIFYYRVPVPGSTRYGIYLHSLQM
jgi:hypothetical protein